MIDFELIETFLKSRENYIIKFPRILNMYKERFRREINREDIMNWEDAKFLAKIKEYYIFLRLNFQEIVKNFYSKTGLEVFNFKFIPFVGLGVVNEWVDTYKNQICSFMPLENVKNIKSLIVLTYKVYALGYILNANEEINLDFYSNLRNLVIYGFGNFISTICLNYNVLIPIWQSQRSIHKIWLKDLERNLRNYSLRFLSEIEDSSFIQFHEWFITSRKGQYLGYKLFQNSDLKTTLKLSKKSFKLKFYELCFA